MKRVRIEERNKRRKNDRKSRGYFPDYSGLKQVLSDKARCYQYMYISAISFERFLFPRVSFYIYGPSTFL